MCFCREVVLLRRGKWEIGIAVCSFVVGLVSMTVMLAVDPRESVSRSERRRLAEKPELTDRKSVV